jgi:glycosyltransferase involved in cell wall biosynthesis
MNKHIRILQVSTMDNMGGAEKVASNLYHAYHALGYPAWLAVGYKYTDDLTVLSIPNDAYRSTWARIWLSVGDTLSPLVGKVRWARRLRKWLHWIGQPSRLLEIERGHEDFEFPSTWRVLDLPPERPDIVHCHNLHGSYFDLRALLWLSQQVPVVLTLHDEWLFSGHCAYTLGCERWKTGCGHCPDLTIYPAVRRDATAYNWQRKADIYAKCRLYVATPCRWLMQKVEQSMLAPAVADARLVPNGVDTSVFHPSNTNNRREVRTALRIPQDARVLLFTANGIRRNIFKDYQTMRDAVAQVADHLYGQGVLFIALGEDAPVERIGKAEVRFVPYQKDPEAVACYYQAADIYVHAACADTFPNAVLEALACGTPAVATAVGGIPEQVKGLQVMGSLSADLSHYSPEEATGILVPAGNAEAMAFGIEFLLRNDPLLQQIGQNAAKDARQRFDLQRQADHYLEWYSEILEHYNFKRSVAETKRSATCPLEPSAI